MTDQAQQLAEQCSQTMHSDDYCAQAMEMQIIAVSPGTSTLTMRVTKAMSNGHGNCHGGMIFSLADTAFAHACNSRNQLTVAAGCSIEYINPAKLGDLLTAQAEEKNLRGRSGIYDITVTNQDNTLIALFRGKSHAIKGLNILKNSGDSHD